MASIIKEIEIEAGPQAAWALVRDVGAADRAFPGVLVASRLEGDVRTVTFANGQVLRERIVEIDEANRRVVYGVIEGRFSHHSASLQVQARPDGGSRVVWISDFLPNEATAAVRPLVEQGAAALRRAVEALG